MQLELWRDIPGWEGRYQASPLGHIRSIAHGGRKGCLLRERYIHRKRSKIIDARVNLFRNGVCHTIRVSQLVALAWCPGHVAGTVVDHIDGDTLNNKASNLEWITQEENIARAVASGLIKTCPCALARNGEIVQYQSIRDAERALGRANGYIWRLRKRGKDIATATDGTEYRIINQEGIENAERKDKTEPRRAGQTVRGRGNHAAHIRPHAHRRARLDAGQDSERQARNENVKNEVGQDVRKAVHGNAV